METNQTTDPDLGKLITFGDKADRAVKFCKYTLIVFMAFCLVALIFSA